MYVEYIQWYITNKHFSIVQIINNTIIVIIVVAILICIILIRSLFIASIILLPLLGLTWAFGILTINSNSTVFAWLFTIFNSLQVSNGQRELSREIILNLASCPKWKLFS